MALASKPARKSAPATGGVKIPKRSRRSHFMKDIINNTNNENNDFIIETAHYKEMIEKIISNYDDTLSITAKAVKAILLSLEYYMLDIFEDVTLCCIHANTKLDEWNEPNFKSFQCDEFHHYDEYDHDEFDQFDETHKGNVKLTDFGHAVY